MLSYFSPRTVLLAVLVCLSLSHLADTQCLTCSNQPATCNFSEVPGAPATTLNTTCVANTSGCDLTTCDPNETVCSYHYVLSEDRDYEPGNSIDLDFSSFCFPLQPINPFPNTTENCAVTLSGADSIVQLQIACCCFEPNCLDVEFSAEVSFPDDVSASLPITSPEATSDHSSPAAVSTWVAVIVTVLCLLLIVVALAAVVCFRRQLRRLCVCWRHKTSQPGISRQYSSYSQPWVLQGLVGQGRFGQVYRALYNGEVVAVKVYSSHSRTTWENERHLFSLESTQHHNIIEFVTSGSNESGGVVTTSPLQLHLVTRYYPLGTLEEYLQANVLSWKQACCVIRSIASGLKHLHSDSAADVADMKTEKYPIAHRDLKSSNILMRDETGDCVIADLGLALQLVPTDDPSELSNHGQAGTIRYMSPEALEARVNLLDLQSFKQIDIYAFSLVMWEVMSRCILTPEDIGDYALPYADVVTHPTLEGMKDIVCSRQLRPLIPSLWSNHEPLSTYAKMMRECWDDDPDARLTAGNILYQMEDLCNSSPQIEQEQMTQSHASSISQGHTPSNQQPHPVVDIGHILFQEHSQSSPPPCYSPTDPVPFSAAQNQENISRVRGAPGSSYFRTSMPHILPTAEEGRASDHVDIVTLTPGCTRSLRSSGVHAQQSGLGQYRPPQSVRNSLVLGRGRTQVIDDPLPTFSDDFSSGSSSHSIAGLGVGLGVGHVEAMFTSSVLELDVPQNADSGIQINHSCSTEGSTPSPTDSADITDITDTRDTTEMGQAYLPNDQLHPVTVETTV